MPPTLNHHPDFPGNGVNGKHRKSPGAGKIPLRRLF